MTQAGESADDIPDDTTNPIQTQQSTKWMGPNSDLEDLFGGDKGSEGNINREEEDNGKSLPMCATWEGDWEVVTKYCSCDVHKDLRISNKNNATSTPYKVGISGTKDTNLYLS